MDTRIQTSFIPKKPIDGASTKASGGIFYLLGEIIFVIALIASIGVFGYQKYLEGRISKMESDLSLARQSLDPELVSELSRADRRFIAADQIIKKHTTLSAMFSLLESLTLQNVRFSSLNYKNDSLGISFELEGEARSYSTLALQAKVFAEDPRLIRPQFSELDLNEDGNVLFVVRSFLDEKAISYDDLLSPVVALPPMTIEGEGTQASNTQTASSTPSATSSSPITP